MFTWWCPIPGRSISSPSIIPQPHRDFYFSLSFPVSIRLFRLRLLFNQRTRSDPTSPTRPQANLFAFARSGRCFAIINNNNTIPDHLSYYYSVNLYLFSCLFPKSIIINLTNQSSHPYYLYYSYSYLPYLSPHRSIPYSYSHSYYHIFHPSSSQTSKPFSPSFCISLFACVFISSCPVLSY